MLTHEEFQAFSRAPELLGGRDELLQFAKHLRECTGCATSFKAALELEQKHLVPIRREWKHLRNSELRRLRRLRQSDADTAESLHLSICNDCATRYQRIGKYSFFFFRPLFVASTVSVLIVVVGLTFLARRNSEDSLVVYRSAPKLGLSAPEDNGMIAVWQSFRWQPVEGGSTYRFTVHDSQTNAIVLQRSTVIPAYVLQPEDGALLASDRTYIWQVEAQSSTAGTLTSAKRRFRLASQEAPHSSIEPAYKDFSDEKRRKIVAEVRKGDDTSRRRTLQELQSYVGQHRVAPTPDIAWAFSEMAVINYYLEDRRSSEEYYVQSLSAWKKLALYPFMYAKTLSNYGLALQDNGKLGDARNAYLEAATVLRSENSDQSRVVLSNALLNLGTLLRRMGLYNEALSALLEAVDLDAKSDRPDKAIAVAQDFTDIGNLYADLQDLPQALTYLHRAHDQYLAEIQSRQRQGRSLADMCEVYQAFADDLGSLGDAYTAKGDISVAISWYSQTRALDERCHSEPHQAAQTLNNLGELYIRRLNQPDLARGYYQRALPLVDKSVDEAWRTYYGLGLVAQRTGQDTETDRWLEKSIDAVQKVSSSTSDPESLRHVWSNRTAPFYLLALLRARQGSAAGALESMERGRHDSWLESGVPTVNPATNGLNPSDVDQGTIGLEYFFGEADDPVLVAAVSHDGIEITELAPARTIEQLVATATQALMAPAKGLQSNSTLLELARVVLPPKVLSGLQNGSLVRVIVSPDGALTQLPLTALAIHTNSGLHYLVELADVTSVPSLSWWSQQNHVAPSWPANDALVVADPIVDEDQGCTVPANLVPDLRTTTQNLPRLRFAEGEAAAVTRYASLHSLVLASDRARVKTFLTSMPSNFKIIHFATHAHAGDDLWSSFISFGCRRELDALTGRQLSSLGLKGQLIVLSACGGSAGKSLSATGSDSIASGFLMSGANAVVASHWPVEDKSAAALMGAFYRELGKGAKLDHALRLAQLQILSRGRSSPRSWATFEVIGNGNLTIPIVASSRVRAMEFCSRYWLIILVCVAVLASLAFLAGSRVTRTAWLRR